MIEINLLQQKKQKSPGIFGIELTHLPIKKILAAFLLYLIVDYMAEEYTREELKKREDYVAKMRQESLEVSKEMRKNQKMKEELEQFNQQIEGIRKKSVLVDELIKKVANPKEILERLARNMNEDVWFDELMLNDKRELQISGEALAYKSIGDFLKLANASLFFGKSLRLTTSSTKFDKETNKRLEAFVITGKVSTYKP